MYSVPIWQLQIKVNLPGYPNWKGLPILLTITYVQLLACSFPANLAPKFVIALCDTKRHLLQDPPGRTKSLLCEGAERLEVGGEIVFLFFLRTKPMAVGFGLFDASLQLSGLC